MTTSRSTAVDPDKRRREAWGNAIRARRGLVNMTQKELASRVDVTVSAVSAWEMGDTSPRDDLKVRVAAVLRTTPSRLFSWGDEA